jgi:PGF-CTERM protein
MKRKAAAVAMVALVVASAVPTGAVAATGNTQDAEAYAGTHVSFDVQNEAVVDYAVDGETVVESMKVSSGSSGDGSGVFDGSVDLEALVSVEGSVLSLDAQAKTTTSATVTAESGAEMRAHDNTHGILVVDSGGSDQAVVANLSSGAEASAESDSQVAVTTEDGTKGTFIVAGEGDVTVNEDGDVSARLDGDSKLVFRAYGEEKSQQDERTEDLIASGDAAAEVYFDSQDGELVTDTVTYGSETTVEAKQTAESEVEVTVDRAASEGKVVVTSVSEAAVGSVQDLSVMVDGEAAVQASSYSELKSGIGGDSSRYMVKQTTEASADVYVAVNHFSERTMTMQGAQDGSGDDGGSGSDSDGDSDSDSDSDTGGDGGSDGGSSGAGAPGFGVTAAVAGLLGAAFVALRR